MSDDAELLLAWRAGNQAAGQELLNRYFDSLYRFFVSKVDGVSEDLIQRTLLVCVEKAATLKNPASFRAYLFTVARHQLYAYLRTTKKEQDKGIGAHSLSKVVDTSKSMGSMMIDKEEQKLLLKSLRKIPMDLQIVIGLHYWEDLSTAELAAALEIPQGTVKSRLRRGREELETAMREMSGSDELFRSTIDNLECWVNSLPGQSKLPVKK